MAEEAKDADVGTDEIEKKINRLERELANVSSTEDKKVLWAIPVVVVWAIVIKILGDYSERLALVAAAGIPVFIFGGLAYVMTANIRRKRKILISRGFKCQNCGFLPRTLNASGVYYSGECMRCKTRLDI